MTSHVQHRDLLDALNHPIPMRAKLKRVHEVVREHLEFVDRIAVATYDPETGVLRAYLHSGDGEDPLAHYEARLREVPSLEAMRRNGQPRVLRHPVTHESGDREHARRLGRHGFASSYTLPMFCNDEFFGFVFFNSHRVDAFSESALAELDVIGHMLSLLVINELSSARSLVAAARSTQRITRHRDTETGAHLDRMSRYARLIAHVLAEQHDLDDEFVQHVFLFAPLHDVGKIAIPDRILLKPGQLSDTERHTMQTHARLGREILDEVVEQFGLHALEHVDMMRNIVEHHHESLDGHGYPSKLTGESIPLEARIVAVADVFDALTSERPYKPAWSVDDAFAHLLEGAGTRFDPDCVTALVSRRDEVDRIRAEFGEASSI